MSADLHLHPAAMLEQARVYASRGFSVIPLEPRGKKPLVKWQEFQTRRASDEELIAWFTATDNNIGIVTGSISGVCVIDCDSLKAINLAASLGLPNCPTVKTGRGRHFYFSDAGARNFQKRDDLPGIDFRGEGGYVVAPPSIHENGASYSWEGEDRELQPLPDWVTGKKDTTPKTPIRDLYAGTSEGGRNDALARLSGVWAKHLSFPDMLEMAHTWNAHNRPALPTRELERTVRSIFELEQRQRQKNTAPAITNAPASPVPDKPSGIVRVGELRDEVRTLYRDGLKPGAHPGWDSLAKFYTVKPTQWTVITGIPGHGKTSFLDALMMNLAMHEQWKFGLFSAENMPHERHVASLAEKMLNQPFTKGRRERISPENLETAIRFLDEHFFFIAPSDEENNLDTILRLGEELIEREGIHSLVIDPWTELDQTRSSHVTETEQVKESLSKVRRFARKHRVHVFVVAHPMKLRQEPGVKKEPVPTLYDISGSAHWRNKADNGICIWRDVYSDKKSETFVMVQKVRFKEVGRLGKVKLIYDIATGNFKETTQDTEGIDS